MSKKNVSLKTIAAECGVSIMTVSRALRDSYGVSDRIKEKIRKKAIELGYMPNHVVQSMSKDEKPVIAVLIDSFNNLYFSTLINELMKLLKCLIFKKYKIKNQKIYHSDLNSVYRLPVH